MSSEKQAPEGCSSGSYLRHSSVILHGNLDNTLARSPRARFARIGPSIKTL